MITQGAQPIHHDEVSALERLQHTGGAVGATVGGLPSEMGRVLYGAFELDGVPGPLAAEAFERAAMKLPIRPRSLPASATPRTWEANDVRYR